MGSSFHKEQAFHLKNWIPVDDPKSSLFPNINIYRNRLLLNTVTNQYIEQYNLHFVSWEESQTYLGEIEWRREGASISPPVQIYPVKYFRDTSTSELCSTIYTGSIYFDRIQMRLKQINDIPLLDGLYLLKVCLQGFGTLYKTYGVFEVREDLVFISEGGMAKVWINSNLAHNIPHNRETTQTAMVTTIISMIQDNIDQEYRGEIFFSDFLKQNQLFDEATFEEALHELNNFCELRKLNIPSRMKSVADLYEDRPTGTSGTTEQSVLDSHSYEYKNKSMQGDNSVKRLYFGKDEVNSFGDEGEVLDGSSNNRMRARQNYQFTKTHFNKPTNHSSSKHSHEKPVLHRPTNSRTQFNQNSQSDQDYSLNSYAIYRVNRSRPVEGTVSNQKPLTPNSHIQTKIEKNPTTREYFKNYPQNSAAEYTSAKIKLYNKHSEYSQAQDKKKQQCNMEQTSLSMSKRIYSAEPRLVPSPLTNWNKTQLILNHLNKTGDYRNSSKVPKETVRFNYMPTVSQVNSPRNLTPSNLSSKNKSTISYSKNYYQTKPSSVKPQINSNFQSRTTNISQNAENGKKMKSKGEESKKYYTSNESYQLDPQIAADLERILKEEKM